MISKAFILDLVSSPVLVPLCPLKYVVDIAEPCHTPLDIVPTSVISKAFILDLVSSPVLVPLFVPVISDVIATVPVLFGRVYVTSAPATTDKRVASCPSAVVPSNTTPLDVEIVVTLFVVVVPVTTKSPGIVTVSVESPIDTAFEPKPPANLVFKFATETSSLSLAVISLTTTLTFPLVSSYVVVTLVSVLEVNIPPTIS